MDEQKRSEEIQKFAEEMKASRGTISMPSREHYWNELGIEEKLERMRKVVKNLQRDLNEFSMLVSQLSQHEHADGKMVVPFQYGYGIGQSAPRLNEEGKEWF